MAEFADVSSPRSVVSLFAQIDIVAESFVSVPMELVSNVAMRRTISWYWSVVVEACKRRGRDVFVSPLSFPAPARRVAKVSSTPVLLPKPSTVVFPVPASGKKVEVVNPSFGCSCHPSSIFSTKNGIQPISVSSRFANFTCVRNSDTFFPSLVYQRRAWGSTCTILVSCGTECLCILKYQRPKRVLKSQTNCL